MFCKIAFPTGEIFRLAEFPKSLHDLKAVVEQRYPHKVPKDYVFTHETSLNMPEVLKSESQFAELINYLQPGQTLKLSLQESVSKDDNTKSWSEIGYVSSQENLDAKPHKKLSLAESFDLGRSPHGEVYKIIGQSVQEELDNPNLFNPEQIKFLERLVDKKLERMEQNIKNFLESRLETLEKKYQLDNNTRSISSLQNEISGLNETPAAMIGRANSSKSGSETESSNKLKIPLSTLSSNATNSHVSASLASNNGITRIKRASRGDTKRTNIKDQKSEGEKKLLRIKFEGRYICDGCGMNPLVGPHYKCTECSDFDFCETCTRNLPHEHLLHLLSKEEEKARIENITRNANSKRSWILNKDNFQLKESQARSTSGESEKKGINPLAGNAIQSSQGNGSRRAYKAKFVQDSQNSTFNIQPSGPYEINFKLRNTGELKWPELTEIHCIGGCHVGRVEKIKSLQPGEETEVKLSLKAPDRSGMFSSSWKLYYPAGDSLKTFGPKLSFEIQVEEVPRDQSPVKSGLGNYDYLSQFIWINLESRYSEEVLTKANFLKEMFGGDLRQHLDFVSNCKSSVTVEEIVELYLQADHGTN